MGLAAHALHTGCRATAHRAGALSPQRHEWRMLLQAAGWGPGPHSGEPPIPRELRSHSSGSGAGRLWRPFSRRPRPALGPLRLCLACRVRCRAAPPQPLRGLAPAFRPWARPGRSPRPPFPRSATCARWRAPRALAGPGCLRPRSRCAAGFLAGALAALALGPCAARGPAGGSLLPLGGVVPPPA